MCSLNWYNKFYNTVENSKAYSEYCTKVFGKDFSQQGFSDIAQLEFMLAKLDIKPGDRVLDIGCGNGKMLEYICEATGAEGYGFDFSDTAISYANKRISTISSPLHFITADIANIEYPDSFFDKIISVDTLYFTNNLADTLSKILGWLKPGGQLAVYYSMFRFDENQPLDMLTADKNDLAHAVKNHGLSYEAFDHTQNHYELMKLKKRVIGNLKYAFEQEGSMMLYENSFRESIDETVSFDEFTKFSSRYLYIAGK